MSQGDGVSGPLNKAQFFEDRSMRMPEGKQYKRWRKKMKRTIAIIIELIPVVSAISAFFLLKRDVDSAFLRSITMIVFIFAFLGFVAFFIGRKLAGEDKMVKILGILDWIATAVIVGIYAIVFFALAM